MYLFYYIELGIMFPNVLAPTPVYQSLFRTAHLGQQPTVSTSSASFLVENLLRDRNATLLAQPLPLTPRGAALTLGHLSRESGEQPPTSSGSASDVINNRPVLKFGVSAILGTESANKLSELYLYIYYNFI